MDLMELLFFVFLFVVLPMLQRLGKKPEGEELPEERSGKLPSASPPETAGGGLPGGGRPGEGLSGGWSDGWGDWPRPGEAEGMPEVLVAEEADEAEEAGYEQEWMSREAETRLEARPSQEEGWVRASREDFRPAPLAPEAERVYLPVASMEALRVDRVAEHRRFHKQITEYAGPPVLETPGRHAVRWSRQEVRKAIVLSELLGPPRSLQHGDPGDRMH